MTNYSSPKNSVDPSLPATERSEKIDRRDELVRLRDTNARMRERVRTLEASGTQSREVRLAALNLMEDAVNAQRLAELANERLREEMKRREGVEAALRESEERQMFLLKLSDALRPLGDPVEIQKVACRLLGEHLEASRVAYAEIAGSNFTIRSEWVHEVKSMIGLAPIATFSRALLETFHQGDVLSSNDIETDPCFEEAEKADLRHVQVRSFISFMLIKSECPAGAFGVHCASPREWTQAEVILAREVAERIWLAAERARAEMALRENQERLLRIVENAREYAIISTDLDRRVTSWNPGATRLLRYSEDEILGTSADVIFCEEDRLKGVPDEEARLAIENGRASNERWHTRKDGSQFWGSGAMMPLRDAGGTAIGLIKIFRDQTVEKEVKEALEKSQAQLKEALAVAQEAHRAAELAGEAKDHFFALLSHELRTPLTPVLMTAQTLSRRPDIPEDLRATMEMIRRNVQLESHFIDDLLDITRIAHGKLEIHREPVDVHAVIQRAAELSQPDVAAKEQRFGLRLKASHFEIIGDARRLQQVIWNLLKNSSKFTPARGKIEVTTQNKDGNLLIEVHDDGIGIEPEALGRIFESFVQADRNITREYGGLGLGLAISKAVVDAHGGSLQAASPGQGFGATFTIRLPLDGRK